VLVFDLTTKYIFGFFLLLFLASYINFWGFNFMIRHLDTPEGPALRKRMRPYWFIMNALYLTVLGVSFSGRFGPFCDPDHVFPPIMSMTAALFLINSSYHQYLHKRDYFLKWTWEETPEVKWLT